MILNKLRLLLFVTGLLCLPATAQKTDSVGYFLFPIRPGTQNFLSGTMGELRPNHFHGGIDIKTDGKIGLPVLAAADGYISRVKQSSYGYGNLIYITHPNGLITTYAHLHEFGEPLATHILKEQYKRQVFDLELFFKPTEFPVNRGQVIGISGNTGGSGGPHLHFEVRDEKGNLLNPLLYGFTEVIDKTPPTILALGVRPLKIDSRVNNRFEWEEYKAVKRGANYTITDTIFAHGDVGFSFSAFDRLDGAANKNGMVSADMKVNGRSVFAFNLTKIPFAKSRHILKHTDFWVHKTTGRFFQNCYLEDGNELNIYSNTVRKGFVKISPDSVYTVQLVVEDFHGNRSILNAVVKGQKNVYTNSRAPKPLKPKITYEVQENFLKVTATDTSRHATNAELYVKNIRYDLLPSYTHQGRTVYLYDLRGGLPDSLTFCGRSLQFTFQQIVPSTADFSFHNAHADLAFPEGCLFDTLYLTHSRYNGTWEFNDVLVPLAGYYKMTLKNAGPVEDKTRTSAYALGWGNSSANEGGKWENDNISFSTRNFGKFGIKTDDKPPTIAPVGRTINQVSFRIRDNLSGIASWRAELNGEWLLMKFEHKEALIFSEKLDKTKPLKGNFVLTVTDRAGNEAVYKTVL